MNDLQLRVSLKHLLTTPVRPVKFTSKPFKLVIGFKTQLILLIQNCDEFWTLYFENFKSYVCPIKIEC